MCICSTPPPLGKNLSGPRISGAGQPARVGSCQGPWYWQTCQVTVFHGGGEVLQERPPKRRLFSCVVVNRWSPSRRQLRRRECNSSGPAASYHRSSMRRQLPLPAVGRPQTSPSPRRFPVELTHPYNLERCQVVKPFSFASHIQTSFPVWEGSQTPFLLIDNLSPLVQAC